MKSQAAFEKHITDVVAARKVVIKEAGGYQKGIDKNGMIDCPICKQKTCLIYKISGYNGHVWAVCNTKGCVSWME